MTNSSEHQYLDLLEEILNEGNQKGDRTGTGTISLFGKQMRFDLSQGFPLITTKKVHFKSIAHELIWFIKGDTNIKYLKDNGVKIWDEWADENGDLGPVYGHQWRSFGEREIPISEIKTSKGDVLSAGYVYKETTTVKINGVDQLDQIVERIKSNPNDRRLIVSAWNPQDVPEMALPPCHMFFQFYVSNGKLSCQMYQRSADMFLGVPFNIASYALLTMMVAHVCDLEPGEFIHVLGDAHIYNNHIDQVKEQLGRQVLKLPTVKLNKNIKNIFDFKYEDIELIDYISHDAIKAKVAV